MINRYNPPRAKTTSPGHGLSNPTPCEKRPPHLEEWTGGDLSGAKGIEDRPTFEALFRAPTLPRARLPYMFIATLDENCPAIKGVTPWP